MEEQRNQVGSSTGAKRSPIDVIEDWIAGLALGTAVVFVVYNVATRYLLGFSSAALGEITRYLVIWSTFFGASRLLRRDEHITIDIVTVRLPRTVQLVLQVVAFTLGAVLCLTLVWYGYLQVHQSFVIGARSTSGLRVPMWIPQLGVPLGALFMFLRFVQHVSRDVALLRGRGRDGYSGS